MQVEISKVKIFSQGISRVIFLTIRADIAGRDFKGPNPFFKAFLVIFLTIRTRQGKISKLSSLGSQGSLGFLDSLGSLDSQGFLGSLASLGYIGSIGSLGSLSSLGFQSSLSSK